jgi:hypothetical protein
MSTCEALSFTIDLEDGHKVIEIHTHLGLNHTRMRKHNETYEWILDLIKKKWRSSRSRFLLKSSIQCDINPYRH